MDAELERFKTDIDLRQFAESLGFTLNRRESWRGSAVMERGQQDKIIITLDADGHHVYFSVKEDHRGTIIDLAKRYVNDNLGHVRKTLRRWHGNEKAYAAATQRPRLEKTTKDLAAVAREWHRATPFLSHAWLEQERRIPPALLRTPRFEGTVRVDERGNVLFAQARAASVGNVQEPTDGQRRRAKAKARIPGGMQASSDRNLEAQSTSGTREDVSPQGRRCLRGFAQP